jgi:hypothetical protein
LDSQGNFSRVQIDAWPLISQTGERICASKPVRFVSEDAFFPTSTARSIRKGGMKHRRSTFDGMINCSRTRKKSCVACGWVAGCSRLLHCILSGMHAPPTVGVMPDSYDTSKCTGGTWAIRLSRETAQRTSQGAMWSSRGLPAVRVGTLEVGTVTWADFCRRQTKSYPHDFHILRQNGSILPSCALGTFK